MELSGIGIDKMELTPCLTLVIDEICIDTSIFIKTEIDSLQKYAKVQLKIHYKLNFHHSTTFFCYEHYIYVYHL